MKFYELELQGGHVGIGRFCIIKAYWYDQTTASAMINSQRLPATKHFKNTRLLKLKEIDELTYVRGCILDIYDWAYNHERVINSLNKMKTILNSIKVEDFNTVEGKTLMSFVNRYSRLKGKEALRLEDEYYVWAVDLLAPLNDDLGV